jgi:hypothetical protein
LIAVLVAATFGFMSVHALAADEMKKGVQAEAKATKAAETKKDEMKK